VRCVILLVRHAMTDAIGVRLTSREPGVLLNAGGLSQVDEVCACLRRVPLTAVYSSPLERAIATASPIASVHALKVRALEALNEVDYGEWTGLTFEKLSGVAGWREFNESRASAVVPGGECAPDLQRRIITALDTLQRRHTGEVIAAVSHGEVIRSAVLHVTRTPLDLWQQFEISPASITTIAYEDHHPTLLGINEAADQLGFQPWFASAAERKG
jgi:broad specificity phosphatase PhoE